MPLENFDKKKARNYHRLERGSSVMRHSCVAIAFCNKQLPAHLATTIAGRSHLVAHLH